MRIKQLGSHWEIYPEDADDNKFLGRLLGSLGAMEDEDPDDDELFVSTNPLTSINDTSARPEANHANK